MFWIKLWNSPPALPNDPLVPLFTLMPPSKTFKRLGVAAKVWEQFLNHCLDVEVCKLNELNAFIPANTYLHVFQLAMRLCGSDKLIRWYVQDTGPHHFGPVGLAASAAPTVADCLKVWLEYADITAPILKVELVGNQNEITLYYESAVEMGAIQDTYIELCMLLTRRKLLEAGNGHTRVQVTFAHQPLQALAHYQEYYGFVPKIGPRSSLVIPRQDLAIESEHYTPLLYQKALHDCTQLRGYYKRRERVSRQVFQLLVEGSLRRHFYTLDQVADQLHMSVRTLTRRLNDEQVSFRDLHSQVRLELAKKQLQNTELPIKTICSNAGFSNVSAFSRAFRKHMNISPSSFRQSKSHKAKNHGKLAIP